MTRARLLVAASVVASTAWLAAPSHAVPCGPEQEPVCTIVRNECQVLLLKVPVAGQLVCTLG